MKRYHEEKHIIARRIKQRKQINAGMETWRQSLQNGRPAHVIEDGHYRKGLRCGGCTRARCQVCHPEKYPKRQPTKQERQAWEHDNDANS
jgi:hypothetical protein